MNEASHRMIEAAFKGALEEGTPPGDVLQRVAELVHKADRQPCGEGEAGNKARVTTIAEATGEIHQKVMGPDADYVLTLGPEFYVAHEQVYPGKGTTILTIKRREGDRG